MLLMVLPVNGRGIAFSRWTIQRICTASVKSNNKDFTKHEVHRLPFVWVVDDGLTCICRLESLSGKELLAARHAQQAGNPLFGSTLSRPAIGRQRRRVEGRRMFAEAFCEVQKRPRMVGTAMVGKGPAFHIQGGTSEFACSAIAQSRIHPRTQHVRGCVLKLASEQCAG